MSKTTKKTAAKKPAKSKTTAPPKKADKPKKTEPKKTGKAPMYPDSMTMMVLAPKNPKRGKSAERFALYTAKSCKTVGDYVVACVAAKLPSAIARADIRYDVGKGFIKVG